MTTLPPFPYEELCFPRRRAVAAAGGCGLCQREEGLVRGLEESRVEVELREAYAWSHILMRKAAIQEVVLYNHQSVMRKMNDAAEHMLMTGTVRGAAVRLKFEPSVHGPLKATPYAGLVGSGGPCPATGSMPPGASLRAISDELSRWDQPHALEVRWDVNFSAVQLLISQTPGGVASIRKQPPHTIQICQPQFDCDGYYVHLGFSEAGDPVWERAGQMFCGPSRFAALSADGDWLFTDKREIALQAVAAHCYFHMKAGRAIVHQVGKVTSFDAGSGAAAVGGGELRITNPQQLPCLTVEATIAWRRSPTPRHPKLGLIIWAVRRLPRKAGEPNTSSSRERRLPPLSDPLHFAEPVTVDSRATSPSAGALESAEPFWRESGSPGRESVSRESGSPEREKGGRAELPADVLHQLARWIPHPDNTAVAGLCSFLRWGRRCSQGM
eukprot:Hpha_TRINITY_DN14971_c3_g2::TRINITY_DN14971_c3_g2_i1::g.143924::m.143924